ncbi:FtsX-like permease family protein [Novipirellula aureliae]|uniref:FtsX-like permease family protein n=1 Tax=Novipirellula aureliae TaxID=2527966 RepID=A0A5C6DF24_9BACT|nr:FtsX-like permease family protein [Novipirellula aureliae]TWU35282.1 FtsX-like permease family protein [Novipirellula aureliae]
MPQSVSTFSLGSMIRSGLRFRLPISLAVGLGVATATAVIVGALLVGDSMRGSLRELTLERLGKTDFMLAPGSFFELDDLLSRRPDAAALAFFPTGVAEYSPDPDTVHRAGNVQLIGCDERFWELGNGSNLPAAFPDEEGVVLNQSAASELGVRQGDLVTIRLPVEGAVPADSPLGRRELESEGLPRMSVLDIIPDRGLGRFSVTPSQVAPMNVYLSRSTVCDVLDRSGQANMVLFPTPVELSDLNLKLSTLGLKLKRNRQAAITEATADDADPNTEFVFDYYSLTSEQLLLPEAVVEKVTSGLDNGRVTVSNTYLANAIERLDESGRVLQTVPYSIITAIDSSSTLPLDYQPPSESPPSESLVPVVLNDWTARRLEAKVGTRLRFSYYEPEVEKGVEVERTFSAVVTDIVPITEPARPYRRNREAVFDKSPTVYNDPGLTPTVPGVTDQDSINDWDLPFQLVRKITPDDDAYWNHYRLTPKAFLPLADGQRLFGSRFGKATGLRIERLEGESEAELSKLILEAVRPSLAELGWIVRPIRSEQLAASKGTTPFDALFLSLSFFVILSAIMLIAMLFRLGLTSRLRELGTLLAIGWNPSRVGRLVLGEGGIVAAFGVIVGIFGGIGYAMFVLWSLRSWWVGAVTVPFLTFHWTATSILVGGLVSWGVSFVTIWFTVRSIVRVDAQRLLAGRDDESGSDKKNRKGGQSGQLSKFNLIAIGLSITACAAAAMGAVKGGQAAAGGFVGGGMMLLIAAMTVVYGWLSRPRRIGAANKKSPSKQSFSLSSLAARNASRHPLRSTLTIGLMATAAFLIIAMNAFQLQPTEKGTGGFDLIAQTAQPIYRDLANRQIQTELLGTDGELLSSAIVCPLRLRLGQDASCNNLYQATAPTVVGIPESFSQTMIEHPDRLPDFEWASYQSDANDQSECHWQLLQTTATGTADDPLPVVIDLGTAMWSLQLRGGVGEVTSFEFEPGKPIYFQVVGLLSNSLLQGRLMIGEQNFETVFPEISGYRLFLIDSGETNADPIASLLERKLGDVGMDASQTRDVLAGLLAVQNTYLRTFQSLGALGLLLGTIGLAIAQLRSVLDRRGELAVMRAVGFTRRRLANMVMRETAVLLMIGIGCGSLCAILAVLPYGIVSGMNPPWAGPLIIVLGIMFFGMLSGLIAVRQVVRMPLLESLRGQ